MRAGVLMRIQPIALLLWCVVCVVRGVCKCQKEKKEEPTEIDWYVDLEALLL